MVGQRRKRASVLVIVLSLLAPLVGIVAGAVLWRDADSGKRRNARIYLWVGLGAMAVWLALGILSSLSPEPDPYSYYGMGSGTPGALGRG